ncbi:unnamed protein product [Staurois parvus]|nr:unnamed protein product [Staurois parvus]
MEICQV